MTQMLPSAAVLGARAFAALAGLNRFSDEPGKLTRLYLSPAHRQAALDPAHQCIEVDLEPVRDLPIRAGRGLVRADSSFAERHRIRIRHARNRSQLDHSLK